MGSEHILYKYLLIVVVVIVLIQEFIGNNPRFGVRSSSALLLNLYVALCKNLNVQFRVKYGRIVSIPISIWAALARQLDSRKGLSGSINTKLPTEQGRVGIWFIDRYSQVKLYSKK